MAVNYSSISHCPVCSKTYIRNSDWCYNILDTDPHTLQKSTAAIATRRFFCSYSCMRKFERTNVKSVSEEDVYNIQDAFRRGLQVDAIAHKYHCSLDDVESIVAQL